MKESWLLYLKILISFLYIRSWRVYLWKTRHLSLKFKTLSIFIIIWFLKRKIWSIFEYNLLLVSQVCFFLLNSWSFLCWVLQIAAAFSLSFLQSYTKIFLLLIRKRFGVENFRFTFIHINLSSPIFALYITKLTLYPLLLNISFEMLKIDLHHIYGIP